MVGFFSKLFGSKKSEVGNSDLKSLVSDTTLGLIEKGGFDLSFDLVDGKNEDAKGTSWPSLSVQFSGNDEDLLKDKKGQLLDAFQLLLKRVAQHNFPDDRTNITVDCGGYREESEQALIERAESLKNIVLEQGRSVYYRALPPRERKIVHQYLAQDSRVNSRSLGDGLYKKIKIFPAKVQGGVKDNEEGEANYNSNN